MKIFALLLFILVFEKGQSQIITTVAGNGINAYSGDGGLAKNASI